MSVAKLLEKIYPPQGVTSSDIPVGGLDTYDADQFLRLWSLVRGYPVCITDAVPYPPLNAAERNYMAASNEYVRAFVADVEPVEAARRVLANPDSPQAEIDAANATIAAATQRTLSLETLRIGEPERYNTPGDPGSGETAEWITWNDLREINDQISMAQIDIAFYVEYALRHGRVSWVNKYGTAVQGVGQNVKV